MNNHTHLVTGGETLGRECFARNVLTRSIDMKCIFSAIIGAILLNSFTNIVKTNLVKITLFKLKFSIYKQMEMSDFTHSVKSSPRCRHFDKNVKNTQLPSCIARPVAIRLLASELD